jgi:hypothetical protein
MNSFHSPILLIAYLDPATGAIVLQVLLAALLATGVAFRKVILWPVTFLRRHRGMPVSEDENSSETDSAKLDGKRDLPRRR